MKYYISSCVVGFIAFNEDLEIIDYELFKDITNQLLEIRNGNVVKEELDLIDRTMEKVSEEDTVIIESFLKHSKYKDYKKIEFQIPSIAGDYLRSNLDKVLDELGFNGTGIIKNYINIALEEMKESSEEEDKLLIQAINSIDELDESISKHLERIREWYGIYFPEMDAIKNQEAYVDLIARVTDRDKIIEDEFDKFGLDKAISHGADIKEEDIEMLKNFAISLKSLQEIRKSTENYISDKMDKLAPNLSDLLGSTLGAKMIAHAGSLKRLATYPSSTVQIMGAEKAMFRHLKTGERPPKHGLIYQHPKIRGSRWWVRGKIARALSLKISLAARTDLFTEKLNKSINESFLKRVEEIEKDNPIPKRKAGQKSNHKNRKANKRRRRR